jgi:AraC-like DNA-binding protein
MLQVVISLDKPIRIWQHSDQPYQSMMACIIASNVPHQLVMTNRDQPGIILWLDLEESLIARWTPKAPITPFQVSQDTLKELVYPLQSCESAYQLTQTIVRKFIPAPQKAPPDERIQQVCGQIKTNITIQVSPKLDALAAHVAFSPGRLMHLFKEEMGLTVRRYILWQRKLLAMKRLALGDIITTTAHTAGFADFAHLTRTYRQLSGVSPSEIWQNCRFVQVTDCSST